MSATVRGEDGFTLVELLISLALLSLMTAYAISAFGMLRDMNGIAARAAAQQDVDAAVRHMRESLGDVRVQFIVDEEDGDQHLLFEGAADSVRFVTVSNGERETGGLYAVRYVLDETGDLVSERTLLQSRPWNQANRVVLLRGVTSVLFGYVAEGDPGGEAGTQANWDNERILPRAVTVSVGFKANDSRIWPETWVRLGAAN